jgi:hypothetical protein
MVCALLASAAALAGCNQSAKRAGQEAPADVAKAATTFLSAICSENEEQMFNMLTVEARSALKAKGMSPQLPSSGSTSFELGEIELVEGGAHVMSKWFDQLPDGSRDITEVLWMLRKEDHGWRVAGMAMKVYDDQPGVILNFEDPDDMIRKLDLIAQEDERRAQAGAQEIARDPAAATR